MAKVLFVALDQMRSLEWLVGWVQSRPGLPVEVADVPVLGPEAVDPQRVPPALIIAPSNQLDNLEGYLTALGVRQQEVAVTVIFVHMRTPEYGLLIHEGDHTGRVFSQRRSSLAHLQKEIDVVLQKWQVPPEVCERVRGIGFYDAIDLDGHTLHVQTEVAGRASPCIRSSVHRDGTILDALTLPWPPELHERTEAEEVVRKHHQRMLAKARNLQQS